MGNSRGAIASASRYRVIAWASSPRASCISASIRRGSAKRSSAAAALVNSPKAQSHLRMRMHSAPDSYRLIAPLLVLVYCCACAPIGKAINANSGRIDRKSDRHLRSRRSGWCMSDSVGANERPSYLTSDVCGGFWAYPRRRKNPGAPWRKCTGRRRGRAIRCTPRAEDSPAGCRCYPLRRKCRVGREIGAAPRPIPHPDRSPPPSSMVPGGRGIFMFPPPPCPHYL